MSESTILEWLNENRYRAYPLQEGFASSFRAGQKVGDIYEILIDANLVFSALPTAVYLEKIIMAGSSLTAYVTAQPPFVFTLDGTTKEYYCYNSAGSLLVLNGWVNGLIGRQEFYRFNIPFEPSVCCETGGLYTGVTSIAFQGTDISTSNLVNGYQLSWQVNGRLVAVEAGQNEGLPLPCRSFFPSADGVPTCDSIPSQINGATPSNKGGSINLVAGKHLQIYNDPSISTVYIGLDFDTTEISTAPLTS